MVVDSRYGWCTQRRRALANARVRFFLCEQRGGMLACLIPGEFVVERGSRIAYRLTLLSILPWRGCTFLATHCQFAEVLRVIGERGADIAGQGRRGCECNNDCHARHAKSD